MFSVHALFADNRGLKMGTHLSAILAIAIGATDMVNYPGSIIRSGLNTEDIKGNCYFCGRWLEYLRRGYVYRYSLTHQVVMHDCITCPNEILLNEYRDKKCIRCNNKNLVGFTYVCNACAYKA